MDFKVLLPSHAAACITLMSDFTEACSNSCVCSSGGSAVISSAFATASTLSASACICAVSSSCPGFAVSSSSRRRWLHCSTAAVTRTWSLRGMSSPSAPRIGRVCSRMMSCSPNRGARGVSAVVMFTKGTNSLARTYSFAILVPVGSVPDAASSPKRSAHNDTRERAPPRPLPHETLPRSGRVASERGTSVCRVTHGPMSFQ